MKGNGRKTKHLYAITLLKEGLGSIQLSISPRLACKQAGWLIDDCYVRELEPVKKFIAGIGWYNAVPVPCYVCPYQYAVCNKQPADVCPSRPSSPDLKDWLVQVAKAHLCAFIGSDLERKDYMLQQKWIPIESLFAQLASKA